MAECFGKRHDFYLLDSLSEMKAGSMPGNHIYLPYKGVSRQHFVIAIRNGKWMLSDLGSRNGTQVNGKPVKDSEIRVGDAIQAGVVTLAVTEAEEDTGTILLQNFTGGRRRRDTEEIGATTDAAEPAFYFPQLVFPDGMISGQSPAILEVYRTLHTVAGSDVNVLFIGETGSGKEMLAQTLHLSSPRSNGPFVAVNCAAIPVDLAESELFGIGEKVATNVNRRTGKMELAHRGTLLLDELSSFPISLQAKILRVVEEKTICPVGESKPHPADFRLLATSNEEPGDLIEAGRLREDLYHRIATVEVHVPPLRKRPEDIQPLLLGLVAQRSAIENKPVPGIRRPVLDLLLRYSFPGNVRELANIVKSMMALANPGEVLDVTLLPEKVRNADASPEEAHITGNSSGPQKLQSRLDDVTREIVRQALELKGGNITQTADHLGVTPRGLRKMMQRLGLTRP